jgi:hypothetical protein
VLGQLASSGSVDLKSSVSFLGDKGFWGGLVGSGVGYSVAALAIQHLLPPGFGGVVAAFLPTFGALSGSFLGAELGSRALREGSLKNVLSSISIAEILAQAAGSTVGMFVGANLLTSLAAGMGSFAGPVGSIVGGIVGAQLGMWVVRTLKGMFTGGSEDPAASPAENASRTRSSLPASPLLPAADLRQIQDDYRAEYVTFIQAEQKGDRKARELHHRKLEEMRKQYELAVRSLMSNMATPGHRAPDR